ncbi:MAG: hypothetical protein K8R65_08400 [Nitrospirae bacterium]|nr:hypothetical protein [Nitrospirota bacterium]
MDRAYTHLVSLIPLVSPAAPGMLADFFSNLPGESTMTAHERAAHKDVTKN